MGDSDPDESRSAGEFEALSVTDDGQLAAKRTEPREQFQRDLGHPGSVLLSVSGSATKRTTAAVKADRYPRLPSSGSVAGLHPPGKPVSNEKKNTAFVRERWDAQTPIGRYSG
jgi:hypothetical protein